MFTADFDATIELNLNFFHLLVVSVVNLLSDSEKYRTDMENVVHSSQAKFTEVLHRPRIVERELVIT